MCFNRGTNNRGAIWTIWMQWNDFDALILLKFILCNEKCDEITTFNYLQMIVRLETLHQIRAKLTLIYVNVHKKIWKQLTYIKNESFPHGSKTKSFSLFDYFVLGNVHAAVVQSSSIHATQYTVECVFNLKSRILQL